MARPGRRPKIPHDARVPLLEVFRGLEMVRFLDRDKVSAALLDLLHPEGAACPDCGNVLSGKALDRWARLEYVVCPSCQRKFGWRAGTVLDGCHADPCIVLTVAVGLAADLGTAQVSALSGLNPSRVREWKARLSGREVRRASGVRPEGSGGQP